VAPVLPDTLIRTSLIGIRQIRAKEMHKLGKFEISELTTGFSSMQKAKVEGIFLNKPCSYRNQLQQLFVSDSDVDQRRT
jgi:hypothetical protein